MFIDLQVKVGFEAASEQGAAQLADAFANNLDLRLLLASRADENDSLLGNIAAELGCSAADKSKAEHHRRSLLSSVKAVLSEPGELAGFGTRETNSTPCEVRKAVRRNAVGCLQAYVAVSGHCANFPCMHSRPCLPQKRAKQPQKSY